MFSWSSPRALGVNKSDRAAAAARSCFPPLPSACHLQRQHGLRSRPLRQKARNGNGDSSVRRTQTKTTLRKATALEWRRQWADGAAGYLRSRPRRKMSPGTSLGRSVDSHNPQRVDLSKRASAARGARQLLEHQANLLHVNLLPR